MRYYEINEKLVGVRIDYFKLIFERIALTIISLMMSITIFYITAMTAAVMGGIYFILNINNQNIVMITQYLFFVISIILSYKGAKEIFGYRKEAIIFTGILTMVYGVFLFV